MTAANLWCYCFPAEKANSYPSIPIPLMGGPWSVNTLAQVAGTAALQDTEHNQNTLEFVRQERRALFQQLEQFPQLRVYPSNVNYLLVEIKEALTARELRDRLVHQRILVRDCGSFMGLSERFFRIAIRTVEENQRLLECLRRVFK